MFESIELRGKAPLSTSALTFIPGEDIAPNTTAPSHNGTEANVDVLVWDAAESKIDFEGNTIRVRGLKQTLEKIDSDFASQIENESVYEHDGLSIIELKDVYSYFENNQLNADKLTRMFGINPMGRHSKVELEWEAVTGADDYLIGIRATMPDGFTKVYWASHGMNCPVVKCLAPLDLTPLKALSEACYLWDQPDGELEYPDDNPLSVISLGQLCLAHCPQMHSQLYVKSFTYHNVALVQCQVADKLFEEATGQRIQDVVTTERAEIYTDSGFGFDFF